MTDSERQKILKMIEEGKITPEEGLVLMQALDDEPAELPEDDPREENPGEAAPIGEAESEKERREAFFAGKLNRFRRLWILPMIFGILLTVGSAYWMFAALEKSGLGFWFLCAWLPLTLGILAIALAFSSRESRWLYLNVKQKPGETPQRIVISFPMNLVTWLVNVFGNFIPGSELEHVGTVMDAITQSLSSEGPVMIEVHEEDGEDVQVYIG